MAVRIQKRLLSTEEYHLMGQAGIMKEDDRVELINGEIIQMSPIGSNHAGHVKILHAILGERLRTQVVIGVQDPIHLDEFNEPQPDIAVLKPREDFYTKSHPSPAEVFFLIEVADSSFDYDRDIKLPIYAKAGIQEVWILDLKNQQIEVYRQPKNNRYALRLTLVRGDVIRYEALDFTIEVDQILMSD